MLTKPNSLYVLIKGNKFQAAHAAADRGIPFAFWHEHQMTPGLPVYETAGFVPESYRDKVMVWLAEDPTQPPFPIGSCLHFQFSSNGR